MKLLLSFLSLLLLSEAWALLVAPADLEKELSEAPFVVEIEGQSLETVADESQFAKFRATVTATKVLRTDESSALPMREGATLIVSGPGGELNETGLMISGYPKPYVGKRYRAYLKPNNDGTYAIAGYQQGLIPLEISRAYSRNRTDGSNGSGEGPFLFWDPGFFPIPFFISARSFLGHPDFPTAIYSSFRTWRAPEQVKVEFLPMGCTTVAQNQNDGINAIILIKENWPFDSSAIAITRNFYVAGSTSRSGLILDSDILLNGVHHDFTTTNENGAHDVQNIVTHEVGHFLGLGHEVAPANVNAVMYAVASPNETKKRRLHESDLEGITSAYPGLGMKNDMSGILCEVSSGAGSCLSAPHRAHSAPTAWAAIVLMTVLAGLPWIGRRIFFKRWSETRY